MIDRKTPVHTNVIIFKPSLCQSRCRLRGLVFRLNKTPACHVRKVKKFGDPAVNRLKGIAKTDGGGGECF